ncbi:serine/threonine-protein kinase Kin4p [[Candida] jaroonii]|uniref:Serine/threonine-protein kinase Kin4p n=1 Tax=[Candida] jaroonii TaxID=467808 RepID=A0ACA9Y5B1_9ASCO|nr:serine/threonine-protein kinase Kin4p [[Candida] jaroonii]
MSTITEEKIPSSIVKKIHREVRFGNYILGSTLGEGEFGKVKLGWRKDGKLPNQVAIKLIKRDSIIKDSESEIKIHREINSLKILNHPNIVNLVEVMKSGKYIGIVLEYASGGELFDYILHHKYLKENVAKKFFAQLVSGVDYLHSKGLIHRDLKLENLLLDKNKNIIITDFGFVNSYNQNRNDLMKTSCGSPCYAAPELVLTQSPYEGKKVDIWSLGIILYAMLSGYLPFDDDPTNEDGSDIIKLYHYICKTPLTFPEYVSPLARDLLRKIIIPDPKKRIDINAIRNHPWLSSHANLLSIRQPEWDKIYKERNSGNVPQPVTNKRYSMMESTNSLNQFNVSTFKKTHGRSYSYTQATPVEPSISQTSIPESQPTIVASSTSSIQPTIDVTTNKNSYMDSTIISTIIESPKRNPLTEIKDNPLPPPTAQKLPHQPKKPRPTSYHPTNSSYSSLDYKVPSPINIPIAQFLPNTSNTTLNLNNPISINSRSNSYNNSPPKLNLSTKSSATTSASPPKNFTNSNASISKINTNGSGNGGNYSPIKTEMDSISLQSRRNSSVTPINVNGVFNGDNKRNSVLLYLEDKIGTYELSESLENLSLKKDPKEDTISQDLQEPVKVKREKSTKKKADKKRNRFSLLSIYSNYSDNSSSTSLNISPKEPKDTKEGKKETKPKETKPKESKPKESHKIPKDYNKENKVVGKTDKTNKEISAAKKVMDFFKRRSIRVN